MTKHLKILAPTRYPWTFNGPRESDNDISRRNFVPFNKISRVIEGITLFSPFPFRPFDLIHGFNRIPLGTKPYIIGFESHLPRAFGAESSKYFDMLLQSLASDRCRGIYAISQYAQRQFLNQHRESKYFETLKNKLHLRYPNINIPNRDDALIVNETSRLIRLVFIGNHFARKGGTVALRLAELAYNMGLPIHIDIISSLEMGSMSWVDPLSDGYFNSDDHLLQSLPNITVHGRLPNKHVLDIIRYSHFSLLPTFSDSFGFSAIESMANYTPVIATPQGALPEFIHHSKNGIIVPLECDDIGEWVGVKHPDKSSAEYADLFEKNVTRMAREIFEQIKIVHDNPQKYFMLRQEARNTAKSMFCAELAKAEWEKAYQESFQKHA